MILPAASQHSARLEALFPALSRTLPPAALPLPAALWRARKEERRWMMSTKLSLAVIAVLTCSLALLFGVPRESHHTALDVAGDAFSLPSVAGGPIQEVALASGASLETPLQREQRAITEYIAKRYRVADTAVAGYVDAAYRAGAQYSVDPLLILAVMAVESRYNPVAESGVGAKGLMQIIPRFHLEKLADHGGEPALLEPEVNIQVGARILREYQRRFRDTEAALQMYAGAFDEPTTQYANKVLAER